MIYDKNDKQALNFWDDFRASVRNTTTIDLNETHEQKINRIKKLEVDDEAWFKYYFPNFYKAEPAPFHIAGTRRVMRNPEWYEVRPWSRELAKSTRSMFEDLKLKCYQVENHFSLSKDFEALMQAMEESWLQVKKEMEYLKEVVC